MVKCEYCVTFENDFGLNALNFRSFLSHPLHCPFLKPFSVNFSMNAWMKR